jgi:hypothetical protein
MKIVYIYMVLHAIYMAIYIYKHNIEIYLWWLFEWFLWFIIVIFQKSKTQLWSITMILNSFQQTSNIYLYNLPFVIGYLRILE